MQVHMKKLVEIVKEIDGFKDFMAYCNRNILIIGGLCHYGKRIKGKRVLQAGNS